MNDIPDTIEELYGRLNEYDKQQLFNYGYLMEYKTNLEKEISRYEKQLLQKDNIIKEVREYIKFLKEHYEELRTSPVEDSYFIDDMLRQMFIQSIENYLVCIEDILDKVSNDK